MHFPHIDLVLNVKLHAAWFVRGLWDSVFLLVVGAIFRLLFRKAGAKRNYKISVEITNPVPPPRLPRK